MHMLLHKQTCTCYHTSRHTHVVVTSRDAAAASLPVNPLNAHLGFTLQQKFPDQLQVGVSQPWTAQLAEKLQDAFRLEAYLPHDKAKWLI